MGTVWEVAGALVIPCFPVCIRLSPTEVVGALKLRFLQKTILNYLLFLLVFCLEVAHGFEVWLIVV